jgi:CelD/BcsL family acetyltransferase involved in cellulose biosynthesis
MSTVAVRLAPSVESRFEGPTADEIWEASCIEAFGLRPLVVEVEGGRASLARLRGRLESIGAAQLFEPTDFVWRDAAALEALAAAVADVGRPLYLLRVPASSPAIEALAGHYPVFITRSAGACPVVRIVDETERQLSARRRQDLRRARRRAEATPGDVDAIFDLAFAVEARSWKGRRGSALAADALRSRFYRTYGRAAAAAGMLRVALLWIGGSPVAMQIGVERTEALWLLKIGYDEAFAACSPGQLLMLETLGWAAGRGLERCEFLGTVAPWTRVWTREEWPCTSVLACPASLQGAAAAAAHSLARSAAAVLRR